MTTQANNPFETQQDQTQIDILTIDNFDDFAAGNSGSNFLIDDGAYDAIVVGHAIVKTEFEGKISHRLRLFWQLKDEEGNARNIRGNAWTISCNEKATMRAELATWFNTAEWDKIVELLEKGGILVKNPDGTGRFNPDGFIGKRARLLVASKKSKTGKTFNVIASISPFKKKTFELELVEIPWFYVNSDDVIQYKLADGIKIGERKEKKDGEAPNYTSTQQFSGQWVGNEPVAGGTQQQPQQQQQVGQSNAMLANKGVTGAPMNNIDAKAYFNPQAAPAQNLAAALPEPDDAIDLPF